MSHRTVNLARCILGCILAFGYSQNAMAKVIIGASASSVSAAGEISYFEDTVGNLSFKEILALGEDEFVPSPKDNPNLGFRDNAFWFRFDVECQSSERHWVMELGYPLLDHVAIYLQKPDGGYTMQKGGDRHVFSMRHRPHRTLNFSMVLPPGPSTVYIRVQTDSSLQLPIRFYTELAFGDHMAADNQVHSVFYGVILVMILFNGLLCVSLRDIAYFHYVAYLIGFLMVSSTLSATSFQTLWPNAPTWNNLCLPMWFYVAFGFSFQCSLHFLLLDRYAPRLAKVFSLVTLLCAAGAVASLFLPYAVVIRPLAALAFLSSPMIIAASGIVWYRGYTPARLFLVGWSAFLVGVLVYGFKTTGILPTNMLTENGIKIGCAIEVVFLSLALAERIHVLQAQKSLAQQEALQNLHQYESEMHRRESLELANNELALEIGHATEQLVQADKMASLGQMVAGVAHEIANPTNYISNATQVLKNNSHQVRDMLEKLLGGPDPEALRALEGFTTRLDKIDSQTGHIALGAEKISLINGALRNYSRLDPQFVPGELVAPIADEVFAILANKLKAFDVHVKLAALPGLEVRRSQIGQVLANLVGNAADALEEKAIRLAEREEEFRGIVAISGVEQEQDGRKGVCLYVDDNGDGVPVAIQGRVMQAFFTTKGAGKGTGLGMSISRKILEAHQGMLEIGTAPELGGARMAVWLPLSQRVETL